MSRDFRPLRNEKLASSVENIEEAAQSLSDDLMKTGLSAEAQNHRIQDLQARLKALAEKAGLDMPVSHFKEDVMVSTDDYKTEDSKKECAYIQQSFRLDTLSNIDIALACVAGGLGVLIDFLVVKIPKTTNIIREGESISQNGSPLTGWMRKIGLESDNKTSPWVKTLEKWFGVNYDTSIIKGEKGFYPKTHRIYSLAHDPSPSGLLWAIKDMATGTFSYIDKAGRLKIIPSGSVSPFKVFGAPVVWLGHLISDIFTKAGVPIPGSCLLRTLQFGSLGDKKRTVGEVIEYMYLEGYDLRHLATMSIVNACVEIIIRLCCILTKPRIQTFARPAASIQADKEMIRHKLQKMRLCGFSVAATGNVAKLTAYQWNPTALNAPVWLALVRASIAELEYQGSTTREVMDIMECRSEIEANFDRIQAKLADL